MAESKDIRIRAVLDDSGFDQKIRGIQQKLQQMNRMQQTATTAQTQYGAGSKMSGLSTAFFGDFNKESIGNLREAFNLNSRKLQHEERELKKKQKEMRELQKIDEKMNEAQKSRVKLLKDEIDMIKQKGRVTVEENNKIFQQARAMGSTGTGFKGVGAPPPVSGGVGGVGGPARGPGMLGRMGGMLRGIGGAALVGGALAGASNIMEDVFTRDRKIALASGTALTGAARELGGFYQGQGSEALFYAQERAAAAQMASKEAGTARMREILGGARSGAGMIGGLAGAAGGATLGAKGGAALGAGIGGLVGGVGALPGAVIGAGLGFVGGGLAGAFGGSAIAGGLFGGERTRAALFDPEKYSKMVEAGAMGQREQIEAALIARDPTKYFARKSFMGNVDRDVAAQRSLGIDTDAGYYGAGGFLQTQMGAGLEYGGVRLEDRDVLRSSRQITQAGGSTRAALELSGRAGAFNRQMNIGNTGQLMGALSGAGLSAAATEEATKKLFAEAVRRGVDTSKMPQEMQRFTQAAAQIATAGGGFSGRALTGVGQAMIDTSKVGIQAAATEFQQFQQTAKAGGGYEAQLGFGFFQGGDIFKGVEGGQEAAKKIQGDSRFMNLLNQLSAEDLEKDPLLMKGLTEQLGVSEEAILDMMGEKDVYKQTRTKPETEALKKFGAISAGKTEKELLGTQGAGSALLETYIQRAASRGQEFTQQGTARRRAEVGLLARKSIGAAGPDMDIARAKVEEQLRTQQTQAGELELGARAGGQAELIKAVSDNTKQFADAAKLAANGGEMFARAFEAYNEALTKNGGEANAAIQALAEQLQKMSEAMDDNGYTSTKPSGE